MRGEDSLQLKAFKQIRLVVDNIHPQSGSNPKSQHMYRNIAPSGLLKARLG